MAGNTPDIKETYSVTKINDKNVFSITEDKFNKFVIAKWMTNDGITSLKEEINKRLGNLSSFTAYYDTQKKLPTDEKLQEHIQKIILEQIPREISRQAIVLASNSNAMKGVQDKNLAEPGLPDLEKPDYWNNVDNAIATLKGFWVAVNINSTTHMATYKNTEVSWLRAMISNWSIVWKVMDGLNPNKRPIEEAISQINTALAGYRLQLQTAQYNIK